MLAILLSLPIAGLIAWAIWDAYVKTKPGPALPEPLPLGNALGWKYRGGDPAQLLRAADAAVKALHDNATCIPAHTDDALRGLVVTVMPTSPFSDPVAGTGTMMTGCAWPPSRAIWVDPALHNLCHEPCHIIGASVFGDEDDKHARWAEWGFDKAEAQFKAGLPFK
jgi:hypothetical protein